MGFRDVFLLLFLGGIFFFGARESIWFSVLLALLLGFLFVRARPANTSEAIPLVVMPALFLALSAGFGARSVKDLFIVLGLSLIFYERFREGV